MGEKTWNEDSQMHWFPNKAPTPPVCGHPLFISTIFIWKTEHYIVYIVVLLLILYAGRHACADPKRRTEAFSFLWEIFAISYIFFYIFRRGGMSNVTRFCVLFQRNTDNKKDAR